MDQPASDTKIWSLISGNGCLIFIDKFRLTDSDHKIPNRSTALAAEEDHRAD